MNKQIEQVKKMKGRFIYISGTDGSGKTTLCQKYIEMLNEACYHTKYVWMRFPHLFSLAILAYCRLMGLTKYKTIDGQKVGKWEFYRSPVICAVLPWVLLFDTVIRCVYKIYLPVFFGRVVVCDRFVIDILVDLMVSTKHFDLHRRLVGKLFMRLIPWNISKVMVLDVDPKIIVSRRKDLNYDNLIKTKIECFRLIAEEYNLTLTNADSFVDPDWGLIVGVL